MATRAGPQHSRTALGITWAQDSLVHNAQSQAGSKAGNSQQNSPEAGGNGKRHLGISAQPCPALGVNPSQLLPSTSREGLCPEAGRLLMGPHGLDALVALQGQGSPDKVGSQK